jgi:predicted phosphodiesterase
MAERIRLIIGVSSQNYAGWIQSQQDELDLILRICDAIGIGPFPAECLERLLALQLFQSVMGNHDAWFVNGIPDEPPAYMSAGEADHHRWVHAQLSPEFRRAISAWPYSMNLEIGSLRSTLVHYPQHAEDYGFVNIIRVPTVAQLDELFATIPGNLIWYGHHHPRSDISGRARYVNPGSLGCSVDARARFAILSVRPDGNYMIDFHAVPYNPAPLFRAFETRNVPERIFIQQAFFNHASSEDQPASIPM